MLSSPWIAALVALFLWWFSTGALLCIVRHADRAGPAGHRNAVFLTLPFLLIGGALLLKTLGDPSPRAAYAGFVAALLIWGWIELAFLAGIVTGPNPRPARPGLPGWSRFRAAFGTVAYHEFLILAALAALAWASGDAANKMAFWTFGVLFVARISAKLNLFVGVPKVNTEFLPSTLAHLPSHFGTSRLNLVFPISVTLLTLAVAYLTERAATAEAAGDVVGFALLAALTALALLEHILMVVPLPDERLWRWMMPAPKHENKRLLPEDPHGF